MRCASLVDTWWSHRNEVKYIHENGYCLADFQLVPAISTHSKWHNISLLIIAEVAAMTLWFVSAAILGDMRSEATISSLAQAALSSAVAAGFVAGALLSAITGMSDRFEARKVFAVCAIAAAFCNLMLLFAPIGGGQAVTLRFLTGAFLAGVYPVGMRIAVGWGERDRGFLVGLLVGGLTLGSAAPHLVAYLGGTQWRATVIVTSLICAAAGVLVLAVRNGPFYTRAAKFRPGAVWLAWKDIRLRRAYLGYFGHMWELYAMWAWIGIALSVSFSARLSADEAGQLSKLATFAVIGSGALSSIVAGRIADTIGKAELAMIVMAVSASSAILFALTFGSYVWLTILIAIVWGLSVIPDSAQFSALVADYSPPEDVGSLLTFQTALGFALTVFTVQIAPIVAAIIGWPMLMSMLAIGPLLGILSMRGLLRESKQCRQK